jgi:hypothetical protein
MKFWVVTLFLTGCFFNHPQYCHTDDDCLNGQWCPTVRAPSQPPDVCKGKAIINRNILAD